MAASMGACIRGGPEARISTGSDFMNCSSTIMRLTLLCGLLIVIAGPASAGTRIGGGIHYLQTLGDIKDSPGFDENAIGFLGSVAFTGTMVRFEADLELVPDYAGSDEMLFQPQGYVLLGDFIYGGAGIGMGYLGEFGWQDPFLALRAGVDFMLGGLDLDVFTTYRFQKAKDLESTTSDDLNSLTFGALIRFGS
jgi:hypothetical protein